MIFTGPTEAILYLVDKHAHLDTIVPGMVIVVSNCLCYGQTEYAQFQADNESTVTLLDSQGDDIEHPVVVKMRQDLQNFDSAVTEIQGASPAFSDDNDEDSDVEKRCVDGDNNDEKLDNKDTACAEILSGCKSAVEEEEKSSGAASGDDEEEDDQPLVVINKKKPKKNVVGSDDD